MGTVQLYEYNHILLIRSVFFFYGNKADDALSEQVANDIQYHWNEAKAKVMLQNKWWQVEFSIDGYYKPDMAPEEVWYNTDPSYNYFRIEATSPTHISFVDGVGSNTGYFKLDNLLQTSTTAAHEYGHTLGLKSPGETGGTLNPHYRKVLQTDVDDLKLHKLRFDKNGFAVLGEFTSIYHPFYTAEEI
jgi:hypothetical protein